MQVTQTDKDTLRSLAEEIARIGSQPKQAATASEWRRLNALKPGRPLVWINEIPWHEMNVNEDLTFRCRDPFCKRVEQNLRQTIYQWNHMPGDMVVDPMYYSNIAVKDSGFGITADIDAIPQGEQGSICSYDYHQQINDEKDVEKIKEPVLTVDEEETERAFEMLNSVFGDILPVRKLGIVHVWFSPWDALVQWWDVQAVLMDIALRPELVHVAMDRLVSAYMARLQQWRKLNVLHQTEGNYRVGSGGLGFTDELGTCGLDPKPVRTKDQWGCATAQIFSTVSPEMHEEFALQYERRWLSQFGLNYYGCCEPLHNKLDVLASVPNLRKVSMSPWADLDQAIPKMDGKYVVSLKPSPAVFATDWNPDEARRLLTESLEKTRGCAVEIIMKDISTVRHEPQRLWEWSRIAMDVAEQFA